ncbi:dephospho-CoA kinase [Ottowia thiooxydans]|uniref:dephospho-CoA kinase n=1 Tax=Ottowia thiooxydans TaxID=219182 RepID=UPI00048B9FC0|nr:dephospho-CoA kinase [Ottowia thiooxydans]
MNQPLRLGLTGGIGSGKSTVAGMLAEYGAAIIDSDAISRATTAVGGVALPAIEAAFGSQMIGMDGALDRATMRQLVFSDPSARQRLEAIVHPLISHEVDRQASLGVEQGKKFLVFDVPLLVESGARWRSKVDRVLVVDCPAQTQIERVMVRSGLTSEEVQRVIDAQASREARLSAADIVIYNGSGVSLSTLHESVENVVTSLGL